MSMQWKGRFGQRARFVRATWLVATTVGLVGCGDSDPAASSTAAGGAGGSAGGGGDAAAAGAGAIANGGAGGTAGAGGDPYVDAVAAASWQVVEAAPSVAQGKQDDLFFASPDVAFIASGPNAALYRSLDAGVSWAPSFENSGTFFRAVHFVDDQKGFAGNIGSGLAPSIDDDNVMYATVDGGDSWEPVTAITGDAPSGICNFTSVDAQHVFAVGRANGPSHLMKSSDGGATWTSKFLGGTLMMAIDVHFRSPTDGVIAGMSPNGRCAITRTTDEGETFETVFTATAGSSLCWKLDFPSDDIGYAAIQQTAGGPGAFAKTVDGGVTWEELPLPYDGGYPAIGMGFIRDDIGWVVSDDAALPAFRTLDGGTTWEEVDDLVGPINRFRFMDATTGYAIGDKLYKLEVETPGS